MTYPAIVREEIENWIAWCWDGAAPEPWEPRQCQSLEGRYSAPDWGLYHEETRRRFFNADAARRVQRIFDAMPQLTRQVVKYEYTDRSKYDIWDQGIEVGPDGQEHRVWVRTANNKREVARRVLGVSRVEYDRHVQAFRDSVGREFL